MQTPPLAATVSTAGPWRARRSWLVLALALPLVLGLVFLLPGTDAEPAYDVGSHGSFQAEGCWEFVEESDLVDCGRLTLPLRWEDPDGASITLPVAVFQPRRPDPALAPVIYLSGGPGFPALEPARERLRSWRQVADGLFPGRKLVVFEQRGVGRSEPRLSCPEGDNPNAWWPLSEDPYNFEKVKDRVRAAYLACRDRLQAEGVDLTAYGSRQIAADLEALRRNLDLGRVVLFGLSYGTRIALTAMRDYPQGIEAAILDSTLPPQALRSAMNAEALGGAFDRLFAGCAADSRCASAYPDLEERFHGLLAALKKEPIILDIVNLNGPEPRYLLIDDKVFLEILRNEMYDTPKLSRLPTLIAGLAKGEDWRVKPHAEAAIYGHFPRLYDMGMLISTVCQDEAGLDRPDRDDIADGSHPYLADYVIWIEELGPCALWPKKESREAVAVHSDIPSLLLAGGLDAATPLEQSRQAAETLDRAALFTFPASAHGLVFSEDCARDLVRDFLADPSALPNPPCLQSRRQPSFLAIGGK